MIKSKITVGKKEIFYTWISVIAPSGKSNSLKRQSDWERSEKCDCCDRDIVHVFEVDGKKFGYDCLREKMNLRGIASYKNGFLAAEKRAYLRQVQVGHNVSRWGKFNIPGNFGSKEKPAEREGFIILFQFADKIYYSVSEFKFRLPSRADNLVLV